MSCSDGDLLFDSTSFEFLSVLTKGRATVAKAESKTQAKDTIVNTFEPVPSATDEPVFVLWNVLLPATNLHSTAYPSSWNSSHNEGWVVTNAPFLSMDVASLGSPQKTGFAFGTSLNATTKANTDNYPTSANTVDIIFKNGSPNKDIEVQWTLFRESGIGTLPSETPAVDPGPGYEYSFAMNFANLTADDLSPGRVSGQENFPYFRHTARIYNSTDEAAMLAGVNGIRIESSLSTSSPNGLWKIGFPHADGSGSTDNDDTHIKHTFTSYSGDGIPNGSLSPTYKYLSMVVTYHSTHTNNGENANNYAVQGTIVIEDADGIQYGGENFHGQSGRSSGQDYPRYINGVDISAGFNPDYRAEESGMIKDEQTGIAAYLYDQQFDTPMTFTWDMEDAVENSPYAAFPADAAGINPAELTFLHKSGDSNRAISSITFHGFVFSSTVPEKITPPIHTSSPAAGFA